MSLDQKGVWQVELFQSDQINAVHGDVISIAMDRHVEVVDQLDCQIQELNELIYDCPISLLEEDSTWVYYPWRHRVVRLLGPNGFKRLRTDRNRNKITAEEQQALSLKTIAVIGLSVGHSVAYAIAQEGLCGTLRIADHDELSLSNLNRIPADVLDLGLSKTVLLARRIAELDPYLSVEVFSDGLLASNIEKILGGADLVVDECDSIDIKFSLRFKAKELAIPVIMQTSDGGVLDIERFDLEPERPAFHGLAAVDDLSHLQGLSNADKVPLVMGILEADKVSARLAGSLIEIDEQLTTWPQLASDISFGAGMVGAAVRRWGLGQELPSGRLRLDMDQELKSIQSPVVVPKVASARPDSPVARTPSDEVLQAACRAPSGGNVQPWRFDISDRHFSLFLDPDRSSLMDIKQRGSMLALGAAALNAESKLAEQGRTGHLRVHASALTQAQRLGFDAVAELEFGQSKDAALLALSPHIDKRACARLRGESSPIDAAWKASTQRHAEEMGCQAIFLSGETLAIAAELWSQADRIRFLTPKLHSEMMSELSFPGDDIRKGIDVRTLELSEKDNAALAIAKRGDAMQELAAWGGGKRLGEGSRNLMCDADALMVLTCPGNTDSDYFDAGRLLQRVWLEATRDKVGLHPMTPLFLYATSPSDLIGRVEPADVKAMWDLRVAFTELCGLEPEHPLALTVRATSKVEFTVRSEREPWGTRMIRKVEVQKAEPA